MKVIYCEDCGDIVAPHHQIAISRHCYCERHSCFWLDPTKGYLVVTDSQFSTESHWTPKVYVLGIHNNLLSGYSNMKQTKDAYQYILDNEHPNIRSLNKKVNSLIVRVRPNYTEQSDVLYAHTLICKKCNDKLEIVKVETNLDTVGSTNISFLLLQCKQCETLAKIARGDDVFTLKTHLVK